MRTYPAVELSKHAHPFAYLYDTMARATSCKLARPSRLASNDPCKCGRPDTPSHRGVKIFFSAQENTHTIYVPSYSLEPNSINRHKRKRRYSLFQGLKLKMRTGKEMEVTGGRR